MVVVRASRNRLCALSGAILVGLTLVPVPAAYMAPFPYEGMVRADGYPTETAEQIVEAYQNASSPFTRFCALHVLADRIGEEAIATLRAALDDAQMAVRIQAADLLVSLGDGSGLPRLERDFELVTRKSGICVEAEETQESPDVLPDRGVPEDWTEGYCRLKGLQIAAVLARLGDYRGFDIATDFAVHAECLSFRKDAIGVLVEMAGGDEAELAAKGIDPISVLCTIVQSETHRGVCEAVVHALARLDLATAMPVLQAACSNRQHGEAIRQLAQWQERRLALSEDGERSGY